MNLSDVTFVHAVRAPGGHNLARYFKSADGYTITCDGSFVTLEKAGKSRTSPVANMVDGEPEAVVAKKK